MATATAPRQKDRTQVCRRQSHDGHSRGRNVGGLERWLSLLGGGALALFGLSRGTLGGFGLAALGGALANRGATGHCPMYSALGISTAEPRGEQTSIPAGHGVKMEHTITVNRPPEDLYQFWRNFENLPRFMPHLESVKTTEGNRSHWVAKGPFGACAEWDAEVITERPNELIGWRSLEGSTVDTAGSVHFKPAPGSRGTEVRVVLKYDPPGGKIGATVAWLFGQAPEQEIREDLRRFKQILETGEVPTTAGQPSGRGRDPWQQTGYMVLERRASHSLGWFSIALGMAEILAPRTLGEMIGVGKEYRSYLPLMGLRELASGVAILGSTRPTTAVWTRVIGDGIDLAYLCSACQAEDSNIPRIAAAWTAVAGVTVADLLCALELSRDPAEVTGGNWRRGGPSMKQTEEPAEMAVK